MRRQWQTDASGRDRRPGRVATAWQSSGSGLRRTSRRLLQVRDRSTAYLHCRLSYQNIRGGSMQESAGTSLVRGHLADELLKDRLGEGLIALGRDDEGARAA